MNTRFSISVITALVLMGAGCSGTATPPATQTPGANTATPITTPSEPSGNRLDLSGTGLTSVPQSVFTNTGLTELDLSDNSLTGALPAEIRHLQNLVVLDASGNNMTGVPAEIGQLSNLEVLDLSDNQLTGLPLELGNLSNLKTLDLRGNEISKQDLDQIRANLEGTEILE